MHAEMTQEDMAKSYKLEAPYDCLTIRHCIGDSAIPTILEPVIYDQTIHTAIVMGTQGNKKVRLSAAHRDSRILTIMLMLRKLWSSKNEGVPMHIGTPLRRAAEPTCFESLFLSLSLSLSSLSFFPPFLVRSLITTTTTTAALLLLFFFSGREPGGYDGSFGARSK